jgi:hypothetical protein
VLFLKEFDDDRGERGVNHVGLSFSVWRLAWARFGQRISAMVYRASLAPYPATSTGKVLPNDQLGRFALHDIPTKAASAGYVPPSRQTKLLILLHATDVFDGMPTARQKVATASSLPLGATREVLRVVGGHGLAL